MHFLYGFAQDFVVVEGEGRYVVETEPLGFCRIITSTNVVNLSYGIICDGDDSGAWIAVDIRESPDLFDILEVKSCLFL